MPNTMLGINTFASRCSPQFGQYDAESLTVVSQLGQETVASVPPELDAGGGEIKSRKLCNWRSARIEESGGYGRR
jgi:hypothetical protein